MKKIPLLVVFSLTGCLISACVNSRIMAAQSQTEGDIHKTFSVKPGGKLLMDVEPGSIEVKTTRDSQIVVDVFRKAASNADEIWGQHEVSFEQMGNGLLIHAKFPHEFQLWRHSNFQARYVVSIPHEFNVDLKTSGGSIRVNNLKGDVHARTSGGALQLGKIDGPIIGNTSGGVINLTGCHGKVDVRQN